MNLTSLAMVDHNYYLILSASQHLANDFIASEVKK